jgi:cysteinyl-tRNA synthetase
MVSIASSSSFYDLTAPAKHAPFDTGSPPSEFLNDVARLRATFLDNMSDDFNTGGAIGALYELLTALNRFCDTKKLEYPDPTPESILLLEIGVLVLKELSQILGLFQEPRALVLQAGAGTLIRAGNSASLTVTSREDQLIQLLIELREEARKAKNFATADQIRQRLGQLGITLEDRPGGTGWRKE